MLKPLTAAFLSIVFSLNTVIGFVCAVGIDSWFIGSHHDKTEATVDRGSDHHHEGDAHDKPNGSNDDCCNDHVIKFFKVDKCLAQCFNGIHVIFCTAFISSFYNIDVLDTSKSLANVKYFVRSHHPPIPDIRVAIQSFQI